MAGINKVILVGNLGRDPEIHTISSGTKKASFSIATTEIFKNKEGSKTEHTEWHNIVLWGNLADIAEKFLKKGNTIYLEGKIRKRSWEDDNKNKHDVYEIIGDSFTMLGGRKSEGPDTSQPPTDNGNSDVSTNDTLSNPIEDDLPF